MCTKYKFEQKDIKDYHKKWQYECRHVECQLRYKSVQNRWDHENEHLHDRLRCAQKTCQICEKIEISERIPESVSSMITGVKRKIDDADPNIYISLPISKKQKLLKAIDHAVLITSTDGVMTVVELSRAELDRLNMHEKEPDIDALLALKDDLCIPDAKWSTVVETFQLSENCTLYQIRKRREVINKSLGLITKTPGNGRQQDLKKVLEWLFKREKIDPNVPVRIKFAFDGARITLKQKQKQVVGTVEVLAGKTLQQIKSPNNAHQWIIYVGEESNEDLKKELANAHSTLSEIFENESVSLS